MEINGSVSGIIKILGGGDDITIEPILDNGVEIVKITIGNEVYHIYSPEPGDEVSVTPIQLSGTKIATITIGSTSYDIYSPTPTPATEVVVTPTVQSGTKIASISVNGASSDIYAPQGANLVDYSTEEQDTGLKWIDGKPIYQKTFHLSSPLSIGVNQWVSVTGVTIPNIETPINAVVSDSRTIQGWISVDMLDSPVSVAHSRSAAITIQNLTFWYTKTSDSI